ncbi:MAG TPA: hypothetical protein VJL35_00660 [Gemmatimonadaceae bacterium]|jgi:hypothetical protein|nr:hypothetical protein [Gemmatimonadaceae bacterium]
MTRKTILRASIIALCAASAACRTDAPPSRDPVDTAFAALQQRGQMAMGVDQYTSQHKFEATSEGGRIELQRDTADSLGIAQIRAHLKLIQHAFQAGDFSTPAFVHMRDMPGTQVMKAKRDVIEYGYADLPRGGEVSIRTKDPDALAAIKQFMDAQKMDHRAH